MAERRMFSKTIIDSDTFLDMPMSSQALYFHLSMRADDEGFINNPKKIQKIIGASDDDMRILVLKNYIIPFESGIVVIRHWKLHNYIRNDRFKPTVCKEEKNRLSQSEDGTYVIGLPTDNQMDTKCLPTDNQMDTQDSIEDRLVKSKANKEKDVFVEFAGDNKELLKALKDYETMRNKKKKPLTDRSKAMLINKLKGFRPEEQIPALENAINGCWLSVYPPKQEQTPGPKEQPSYNIERAEQRAKTTVPTLKKRGS